MSDAKTAESLWSRAHEHVRRGDFANAVRDLAQCFQILQALNDPRVYEVHKRWTEVHRMYMEDGQRQAAPVENKAPSVEAEAEAAANAGDLDKAIDLYRKAIQQNPDNELITERLLELTQAKARAADLATGTAPPTAAAAPAVAAATRAEDDWSDVAVVEETAVVAEQVVVADQVVEQIVVAEVAVAVAPTMAVDDAPVGMQSLDVSFSVGEPIDSFQADDLPVAGASTKPPAGAAANDVDGQVAFLESLIGRVRQNRRAAG